jgi:hypothetical protein
VLLHGAIPERMALRSALAVLRQHGDDDVTRVHL